MTQPAGLWCPVTVSVTLDEQGVLCQAVSHIRRRTGLRVALSARVWPRRTPWSGRDFQPRRTASRTQRASLDLVSTSCVAPTTHLTTTIPVDGPASIVNE